MERAATGERRWTLTLYPTNGYAQDAEILTPNSRASCSMRASSERDDPAAAWRKQGVEQQRLIDWLTGNREDSASKVRTPISAWP